MKTRFRLFTIALLLSLSLPGEAGFLHIITHQVAQQATHRSRSALTEDQALELYLPQHRKLGFQGCTDLFPGGVPLDARLSSAWKPYALCSNTFAVLWSGLSKTPLVVIERLDREGLQAARHEQRTDLFYPDPRLPRGVRAELSDFRGSGFDRGHLANAADQPDDRSMAQSFALSNMIPQDPTNNRRIWEKIERDVRKYGLRANGALYVFSGPLFDQGYQTIGRDRIWVPTRLYKLVYDEARGRAWAYILDNTATAQIDPPISYQEFVKVTGLRLLRSVPEPASLR
jgi:endonuclease G